MRTLAFLLAFFLVAGCAAPQQARAPQQVPAALTGQLKDVLQTYLKDRGKAEHISAASLSISFAPNSPEVTVAAGTTTIGGNAPVTPSTLFQIGSNTKAFTSAIILQLESEGKLRITDPLGRFLPQYPLWKNIEIRRLMDMTSGIPTYDNDPAFQRYWGTHPNHQFSKPELVAAVYHSKMLKGYNYSNTGYILLEMIAEKVTGQSYPDLLQARIFKPVGLNDTYYDANTLPAPLTNQMAAGYFANDSPENVGLKPLLYKDMRNYSLSWAQGAGGIVATPSDVDKWARALYQGNVLATKQRSEMMQLVSLTTGQPISETTAKDARGFGLGIAQLDNPKLGRFWFYEGETLGYRVVHAYFPKQNVILSVALNSQPREDHIAQLTQQIIGVLMQAKRF